MHDAEGASFQVLRQGQEHEPVVVIDGFHPDPDGLVAAAARQRFAANSPYYPGIRAPAVPSHLSAVAPVLQEALQEVFGVVRGADLTECSYSLVTLPPAALKPIQRLPHFDGVERGHFALLHFLCGPEHGGTAFYRHRATGFETVTAERYDTYRTALDRDVAQHGLPPAHYVTEQTALFEQIARHDAAYNRAILYRGCTLHSGLIPDPYAFSADPRAGRLTINTFFSERTD